MTRRRGARSLPLIAVTGLVGLVLMPPLPGVAATAGAAAGALATFAGGLGAGPATNVAQTSYALTARNGLLVSVEGGFELPPPGGKRAGLVRAIDLVSGRESVLAGILTGGDSGDGGPAVRAQLSHPIDAAIDAAGNVYITDSGNSRVRKVSPTGTITTLAGNGVAGFSGDGGPAISASLRAPDGIAVSPTGDVVFGDRGTHRIRKVSPSGTITTIAGSGDSTGPAGDGGAATPAPIFPRAMAFDPAGNLYVADVMHGSLRKILVDGTITTLPTPTPFTMTALAVDDAGNVYLGADPGVVRVGPGGTVTTMAATQGYPLPDGDNGDGGPATEARFSAYDLAFAGGNLYLADFMTNRIRRVDSAGIITTVAGNGSPDVSGDGGQARDARFNDVSRIRSGPTGTYVYSGGSGVSGQTLRRIDPSGLVSTVYRGSMQNLAVDDAGNVFFSHANQIRRLSPNGTLTTVAGTGDSGFSGDGGPATLARLASPTALAVDGSGNLYVSDHLNKRIRRIDSLGVITTYVGGAPFPYLGGFTPEDTYLGEVFDLAVDSRGSLHWIEDSAGFLTVLKVTCGAVEHVSGGHSRLRSALAIDRAGSVYFTIDGKVLRSGDGAITTVAGSGAALPLEGVPATSAQLSAPGNVAIHPSGKLLFGDMGRVYEVDGVTAGRVDPGPACATAPLYHPLSPARILDTRTGNGAPVGMVASDRTIGLVVGGRGAVPASGVVAVVLNVTVAEPTGGGYLTVWPHGPGRPLVSNLNFGHQTVANQVVVTLGRDQRVDLYNGGGATHLVVDVAGWYGTGPPGTGSRYTSLSPARILDTRSANGAPSAMVAAGGTIDVQVGGRGGVPAAGAAAVVLNVTVVDPVGGGYLTAWPAGETRQVVSNLNFAGGQTVANLAIAKLGANGKVSVYNGGGAAHLVIDVAGWYALDGASSGTGYHTLSPSRLLDSRTGNGAAAAVVPAFGTIDLQVTGRGGVPAAGAGAVVLNVTVVDPAAGGYLTAWPASEPRPQASNLNFSRGQTVPNLVVVKLGDDGKVSLYNGGGAAHLVADVAGWYGPPR